jgi:DNA-binding MarR family transcriptional regulator
MADRDYEHSVSDLIHSIGLLVRRVRTAGGSNELSMTESAVMKRLYRDGPATTADLARAESVKPQSMGATVAALEQEGLLKRSAHPTDGRQSLLELTAKGKKLRESSSAAKHLWIEQAIAKLSRDEQALLFKAADLLRRVAEQ